MNYGGNNRHNNYQAFQPFGPSPQFRRRMPMNRPPPRHQGHVRPPIRHQGLIRPPYFQPQHRPGFQQPWQQNGGNSPMMRPPGSNMHMNEGGYGSNMNTNVNAMNNPGNVPPWVRSPQFGQLNFPGSYSNERLNFNPSWDIQNQQNSWTPTNEQKTSNCTNQQNSWNASLQQRTWNTSNQQNAPRIMDNRLVQNSTGAGEPNVPPSDFSVPPPTFNTNFKMW